MKRDNDITWIGSLVLSLVVATLTGPPAMAADSVERTREAGFHQPIVYEIMKVSQTSGHVPRFQPHIRGRSIQVIPQRKLSSPIHTLNVLSHGRSQTVLPLILYPWNWGYHYGEMQTPEDVLIEYLEEIYDRQEVAMEEEPIISLQKPAPPPLIIEERCGKYVRITWPESGVIVEPVEEPPCPKTD